ncbi:hypothetical protein [Aliidiomarina quisquiliarum]|uniref:hypothetical protein n=1 Tax=Aliidiomarina quisquiliarum TaxID=2938947 RepID=UPI00208FEEB6|nr:hypothetical protein [Aliidiomarina quisquiliarum]MCO4320041.1 hypothetical protein [Aliidiomarina quisquiliarum]
MQRLTDFIIAFLSSGAAVLLSLPFWRDNEYFAESDLYWQIYFILGFILGVYVIYVFIGSLRMLFIHANDEAQAAQCQDHQCQNKQEGES